MMRLRKEILELENETGVNADLIKKNARLEKLQAKLAAIKVNQADRRPEILKLQKAIGELEKEIKTSSSQKRLAFMKDDPEPSNPAYIALVKQMDTNRLERGGQERKLKSLEDEMAVYQHRLRRAPEVEQKHKELMRDYDNALEKYKEIKGKELEADMARSLEESDKSERLSVLEPPRIPEEPISPQRMLIIAVGFVLGIGCGVGIVVLHEFFDTSIRGVRALRAVTGAPPLMVIPFIHMVEEERGFSYTRFMVYGAIAMLTIGLIVGIDYFVMPLEVAWFTVLRWFGMNVTSA